MQSLTSPDSQSVASHATFLAEMGKKFGTLPQIFGKTDAVWRHVTAQDSAEPRL